MNYPKLQYISQGATADLQYRNIMQVLEQGCSWIQLRWKEAPEADLRVLAEAIKKLQAQQPFTFILNDHVALVEELDLDGVHLGLQDMPVVSARKLLGSHKIIGGTANTLADVTQRIAEGCDYIGLGPYRYTTTKVNLSPVLGITGYKKILVHPKVSSSVIPVYAIGGITADDIESLMETGVYGIAASGLLNHTDVSDILQHINHLSYVHASDRR